MDWIRQQNPDIVFIRDITKGYTKVESWDTSHEYQKKAGIILLISDKSVFKRKPLRD